MEEISDLFVHRYFKFQDSIFFNTTMEHWNIAIQKVRGCNKPKFLFKSCIILLSRQDCANIMARYHFTLFSNLFRPKSMDT